MSRDGGLRGFMQRIQKALPDVALRQAVTITTNQLRSIRRKAIAALPGADDLRVQGRAVRAHVIDRLDEYLAQATEKVIANGGHVHFCRDGEEAAATVAEIARRRGVRLAVKSKSMTSEEIHLNQTLSEQAVRVVETDLGEWIIQLAGETPSHILAPAIHKSRSQIAALFARVTGREAVSEDTGTLAQIAREQLRETFLAADMGISGCNFLVAETGTLVLVTNEGNARMVTTLPKIHVAIMGMERVVATWDDLAILLQLLARSASGQKLSVYTTMITGVRRPGELDGPDEFHLVVVDNGRSEIARSRHKEILHCIRCGACLNVCPVYRHIGGHAYGSPYSGPVGAVVTPLLMGGEEFGALSEASTLCGACTEVCPVLIPIHNLLTQLREDEVEAGRRPRGERAVFSLWAKVFSRPPLYRFALKIGRWAQRPWRRGTGLIGGPRLLQKWTRSRDFPALAPSSFREQWRAGLGDDHIQAPGKNN